MASVNAVNALMHTLGNSDRTAMSDTSASRVGFADILKNTIDRSESHNVDSNVDLLNLLSGNVEDLPGLMVDIQKAEISLNLTVAVRNKAMDAYKEIMNMQV